MKSIIKKNILELIEWYTKKRNLKFTTEIKISDIKLNKAKKELKKLQEIYCENLQHGNYHDGGWSSIALVAANGEMKEDRYLKDEKYLETEAIKYAPTLKNLIDSIPLKKKRVRLLNLKAGKRIYPHIDTTDTIDKGGIRLHYPIITNEKVDFYICHEKLTWKEGFLYYGDFSFPHKLENKGLNDRIHLVIDCKIDDTKECNDFINNFYKYEKKPNKLDRTLVTILFKTSAKI
jgi:aspartyl/asparaginyl beta-hydroxylase (cupin superfamily)